MFQWYNFAYFLDFENLCVSVILNDFEEKGQWLYKPLEQLVMWKLNC